MSRTSTLLILLWLGIGHVFAQQNITFEYDNAGNRVKRLASGPSNGCDCNLSLASSVNATVNQSTTLTATCTGADCNGFTYAWSGTNATGSNLSTTFNAPGTTGPHNYTITATKNGCQARSATTVLNVSSNPVNGSGTGLTGNYFNNKNVTNPAGFNRTDATINFEWGGGSPDGAIQVDNFSARWTGQVEAPVTGTYTFYTTTDDGVRLWVENLNENQPLIDHWNDQGPTTYSGTISLTAGQKYNIRMEYFDSGGGASARLEWSYPNQGQQVIPQSRLYPGGGSPSTQGCVVNNVKLQFRFEGECCMERLQGAKIQGSNNGGSWSDLYTFTSSGNGQLQEYPISNSTSYTSLRFVASNSGWGEVAELEFYNGSTRLTGTPFGAGNYLNAFDGLSNTKWEGTSEGSSNIIGLNLTGCNSQCTPPSAPIVSASPGTITSGAPSTLTASGCSGGNLSWSHGLSSNPVNVYPTSNTTYTATCTVNGCSSTASVTVIVGNPPQGNCYELRLASNQKRVTNVNGVLKVKDQNNSNTQIWKVENDGSFVKIVAQDGTNRVLGVENGGSSSGDIIKLQADAGQDHQRWTQELVSDGNPGNKYGFIRKNASTIISSTRNWGDGDPNDAVEDLMLVPGTELPVYGRNKFFMDTKTCPGSICTPPAAPGVSANPGSISSGNSSQLTASGCSGGSLSWSHGLSGNPVNVYPTSNTTYTATCTVNGCSSTANVTVVVGSGSYSQCIESESASGNGAITSDPFASNGSTRGEENNYNHYVDYVLSNVPSAGTYSATLTYYALTAPQVGVQINGGSAQTIQLASSNTWNIVSTTQTFNVSLSAGTNTIRIQGTGGGSCRQDKLCVSSSSNQRLSAKELLNPDPETALNVFPNPVTDWLKVNIPVSLVQSLEVFNVAGQRVYETKALRAEGVDMHRMQEGLYLIRIRTVDGTTQSFKVLKQ